MNFTRYGIYYTPPPGAFADAGAAWLGWDIATGKDVGSPDDEITARPRKYGFHGTIKPPFRLAPGTDVQELQADLEGLCRTLEPVVLQGLTLTKLGSFLALTPVGDVRALADVAAAVVRGLDAFRAPPDQAELDRRQRSNLSPLQAQNIADWGYPYVMEAFRFHMTLSGPLPAGQRDAVRAQADAFFGDIPPRPLVIKSLTLVGEGTHGKFHEISRHELLGGV